MSNDENKKDQLAIVLRYQGALAAEEHLTKIANEEGDDAIIRVASKLTSAEVARVTSEADLVKPSLLHTAINFEQFRGVFRRVATRWSAAEQETCSPETIQEFQEELKQFFCAFILLNEDPTRRVELLKIILEEPYGARALVFSVVHEKEFPEFITSRGGEVSDGDWREVIGILRFSLPEQWQRFTMTVPRTFDGGDYWDFTQEVAAEMYAVAVAETKGAAKQTEVDKPSDLFTSLS